MRSDGTRIRSLACLRVRVRPRDRGARRAGRAATSARSTPAGPRRWARTAATWRRSPSARSRRSSTRRGERRMRSLTCTTCAGPADGPIEFEVEGCVRAGGSPRPRHRPPGGPRGAGRPRGAVGAGHDRAADVGAVAAGCRRRPATGLPFQEGMPELLRRVRVAPRSARKACSPAARSSPASR